MKSTLLSRASAQARRITLTIISCIAVLLPTMILAPQANATLSSPRVVVYGNSCSGGYVVSESISFNTHAESGNNAGDMNPYIWTTGQTFWIDLRQVPALSGTTITGSFQCSNGQWRTFYHAVYRPVNGIYYDIGWY